MDEALAEVAAIRERLAAIEAAVAPRPPDERRATIVAAATAARFRNPELAARLLADRDGDPAKLVKELAEAEAYLCRPSMDELIRAAARGR